MTTFAGMLHEIEVAEQRPRPGGAPHGSPFTHDDTLRARRLR
jgi:hypothetical protein